MGKTEPASVEFRSVSKRYGSIAAVDDISFRIEPGTLVTLLGPSGCGKTTTLRLIAGLELPTSGEIFIGDREVTRLSAADRNVSMVFQSYALFPHMTVLQNAAYGPIATGMKRAAAEAMAAEKLTLLGLMGLEKRLPSELSGGQQQRVAVARALVLEPQVLLFDEPLSNLDAKLRRRVRDDIRGLRQRLRLTVAYVTHDQQEALAVSDRVIVMSNARIAQSGRPRELYEEPANAFVADFIGDSNQVVGELSNIRQDRASVRVGGIELDLPHRGVLPGTVRIALRPEAIQIEDVKPSAGLAIEGEITKSAYLGTHMEYAVDGPLGSLFIVDRHVARPLPPGRTVWLRLGQTGITVLRETESQPGVQHPAQPPR